VNILLIISSSIAGYKTLDLSQKLARRGHRIRVIMTKNAEKLFSKSEFEQKLGVKIYTDKDQFLPNINYQDYLNAKKNILHIELANFADIILVAPTTQNFIAKLAGGFADDLSTGSIFASQARLILAPAMNTNMWQSRANQENLQKLIQRNVEIIPPESGHLACNLHGIGRLADLDKIVKKVETRASIKTSQSLTDFGTQTILTQSKNPNKPKIAGDLIFSTATKTKTVIKTSKFEESFKKTTKIKLSQSEICDKTNKKNVDKTVVSKEFEPLFYSDKKLSKFRSNKTSVNSNLIKTVRDFAKASTKPTVIQKSKPSQLSTPKIALVTVGPSSLPIDAVRQITNRSSGKMGIAIARALLQKGLDVILLVSQKVQRDLYFDLKNNPLCQILNFETNQDLEELFLQNIPAVDLVFHTAAVADFEVLNQTITKLDSTEATRLDLVPTKKLISLIKKINPKTFLVSFKAEVKLDTAFAKAEKHFSNYQSDVVIINLIGDKKIGFDTDQNKIWVWHSKNKKPVELLQSTKVQLAKQILDLLECSVLY